MKKLNKILKFSAFTLLCTSSLMAAVGDNMSAGLGVNIGNDVQQQTYLDNYTTDHGNGPLVGVDFQTQFKVMDTGSAVAMLDLRNMYYQKIKTDTLGVGFVYRLKNSSMFGQGFHIAYDYTWYDDLDFQQVAMGHEASYQGFDTRLNFYIPFGGSQHYQHPGVIDGGSTLTGLYGVDFTLAKKISAVGLNAGVSYNFHDDINDNITALNLGAEYKLNAMISTGAKYQFRNGLLSTDYGYKVYAKVPLFKGAQDAGKDKGLSAPVRRQLGATIQYENLQACSDLGLNTWAAYGKTWCSDGPVPFDGADIKSGASAGLTDLSSKPIVTVKSGQLLHLRKPTKVQTLVLKKGAGIVLDDGAALIAKKIQVEGTRSHQSFIHTAGDFQKISKGVDGHRRMLRNYAPKVRSQSDDVASLGGHVFILSGDAGISSTETAETADRATDTSAASSRLYSSPLTQYRMTQASASDTKVSTYEASTAAHPIVKHFWSSGAGSNGETTRSSDTGSTIVEAVITAPMITFGSDLNIKNSNILSKRAIASYGGNITSHRTNYVFRKDAVHDYMYEFGQGANMFFTECLFDTTQLTNDQAFDGRIPTIFYKSGKDIEKQSTPSNDSDYQTAGTLFMLDNTFTVGRAAHSVVNGPESGPANLSLNSAFVNNQFFINGPSRDRFDNPYIGNFSVLGAALTQKSNFGRSGSEDEVSDHMFVTNRAIFEDKLPNETNAHRALRIAKFIAGGRLASPALAQLQIPGANDHVGLAYGTSAGSTAPSHIVASSKDLGTGVAPKTNGVTDTGNVGAGFSTEEDSDNNGASRLTGFTTLADNASQVFSPSLAEKALSDYQGAHNIASGTIQGTVSNTVTQLASGDPSVISYSDFVETHLVFYDSSDVTFRDDSAIAENDSSIFGTRVAALPSFQKSDMAGNIWPSGGNGFFATEFRSEASSLDPSTGPHDVTSGDSGYFSVRHILSLERAADVYKHAHDIRSKGKSKWAGLYLADVEIS